MNRIVPLYFITVMGFCCCFLPSAFADNNSTSNADPSSISSDPPQTDNDNSKNWEYSDSIKYSRGKYGTSQESETYEEDSMLQRDFENADLYLTIPSLWQTGNVTATSSGKEIVKKKVIHTTSNTTINPTITGLGDITLNGDYYLLEEGRNAPLDVTLTSYVKAPTASAKNGLGTGDWDGGPGVGFTKKIVDKIKAIADASYYFIGKYSGAEARNQVNLDGGIEYDITPKTTATVKYEYSTSTSKETSESTDIALTLDYKLNDDWKLNGETTFGFSNGSPAETFLLGATASFSGGLLGLFPTHPDQSGLFGHGSSSLFDPISVRIISDPLFLPLKGEVYGTTSYNYTLGSSSAYNYQGNKTANSATDTNTFTQAVAYGVADNIILRLSDAYAFDKASRTVSSTGAITNNDSEGFTNPTIGSTYRVLDQANSSPADLDLTFNISPNAFSAKEAGGGRDGTMASGTQPVAFVAGLGREMQAFTVQGTFTTSYIGNKYYEAYSNNDNYLEQEYFNYEFALNTQTRLTDRLSVNLGTGYTIADKAFLTNLSTGTKSDVTLANTLDFNTAINYHIIPNRLVGGLTYTFENFSNGKSIYTTATSNTETKNHTANIIGARMQYLF